MKFLSIIVGAALLVAAVILSFIVSGNGEKIISNKNKLVTEYVSKSDKALQSGDINGAIKYAKLAISTDPSSSKGFNAYNKVMVVKYKPAEQTTTTETTTSAPAQQPAPAATSDDSSSMGC